MEQDTQGSGICIRIKKKVRERWSGSTIRDIKAGGEKEKPKVLVD